MNVCHHLDHLLHGNWAGFEHWDGCSSYVILEYDHMPVPEPYVLDYSEFIISSYLPYLQ